MYEKDSFDALPEGLTGRAYLWLVPLSTNALIHVQPARTVRTLMPMNERDSNAPPLGGQTPSRDECTQAAVFSAIVATVHWFPAFQAYPRNLMGATVSDATFYHGVIEAMRASLVFHHELPLWNPYECGGVPLWDNPQSTVGAPITWATFLVGTTATVLVWHWLHTVFAFASMWLFARFDLGLSRFATLATACLWATAGFHVAHELAGHLTFAPFGFFPLAMLLWRRASDLKYAVGLGLLFAWMFYEGAVYPLPIFGVLLGIETLVRIGSAPRSILTIARSAVVTVCIFVGIAAARLVPVVFQLARHKRTIGIETDHMSLRQLLAALLSQAPRAVGRWGWHEYSCYVGIGALTLAILGLATAKRRHAWLLIVGAFAAVITLGAAGRYAPWTVLHARVYPFKEMRVPSRFLVGVSFTIAALFGLGADAWRSLAESPRWRRLGEVVSSAFITALAFLSAGDAVGFSEGRTAAAFTARANVRGERAARLHLVPWDLEPWTRNIDPINLPTRNMGRTVCWDEWGFGAGAPLWLGDVPQARVADEASGVLEAESRTQNSFSLSVRSEAPTTVRLNTTYDHGWRTNVGRLVDAQKQLVLELPPGAHDIRVHYWPVGMTAGLCVTLATTIGLLVIGYRVRRRVRGGAAGDGG